MNELSMVHKGTLSEHSSIKSEVCEFRYCSLCNGWFYRHPEQALTAKRTLTMNFYQAFEQFLKAAQTKVDEYYATLPRSSCVLVFDDAPKFIRVVGHDYVDGQRTSGRRAFCFVEKSTGNVLKASGWAVPEKKNPRSCIFSPDFGASGVNCFGAKSLR